MSVFFIFGVVEMPLLFVELARQGRVISLFSVKSLLCGIQRFHKCIKIERIKIQIQDDFSQSVLLFLVKESDKV